MSNASKPSDIIQPVIPGAKAPEQKQPDLPPEETKSEDVRLPDLLEFEDKAPCNWLLIPLDDGRVEGSNGSSGEVFRGTIEQFNKALK